MSKEIRLVDFIDEKESELRFHKTLYFLYGIYYKIQSYELYERANFQAWKYGPVEINQRYNEKLFNKILISENIINILKPYLEKIKKIGVIEIVDLSHKTKVWRNKAYYEEMPLGEIKEYFDSEHFDKIFKEYFK